MYLFSQVRARGGVVTTSALHVVLIAVGRGFKSRRVHFLLLILWSRVSLFFSFLYRHVRRQGRSTAPNASVWAYDA